MLDKRSASSDLQGIIKLLTDATISTIDLAEALHKQVANPSFLPSTRAQKLITKVAGVAFKNSKWSTNFFGKSIEKLLGQLGFLLGEFKVTHERETVRSILNGVIGDYLETSDNPLQITMQFRSEGKTVNLTKSKISKTYSNTTGKILVMVHGSCMNDLQWTQNEHNHGNSLANDLNMTPVFLYYNSGRHISTNGNNFSELLEELILN